MLSKWTHGPPFNRRRLTSKPIDRRWSPRICPCLKAKPKAFWPAYKEYRSEIEKLGDRMAKLIAAYAANFQTMDDTKADAFFKEWMALERDKVTVREKYVPKIRAVLPAQKAARFFQIENKLDAIVNVTLASEIPLVPLKK